MNRSAATLEAGKQTNLGTSMENRYLTCSLVKEIYGIEITKVREIIGIQRITHVPRTPDYVEGVINLRGKVVPVVDLRKKFSLPAADFTRETCIIVVEIRGNLTGLIVDTVIEVASIPESEFNEVPAFGGTVNVDYIHGICRSGGKVVIVLEIENVISEEELRAFQGMAGN